MDRLGTQNLIKITLRNNRPMVPKVVPMGAPVDSKRPPKVTEVIPKIVVKSDAGKRPVSDASKHSKHSSRAGGDTVFARAKDRQKVTKIMPKGPQKRCRTIKKALWKHVRNRIKISDLKKQNIYPKGRPNGPKETPKS